MPKVILERQDIEKLIGEKYPKAKILSWDKESLEITIKLEELTSNSVMSSRQMAPVVIQPSPEVVLTEDGSIDANASGLTLENRKQTISGGPMGQNRGRLRTF